MVPELGSQVPQRGNGFSRWLARFVLRLMGWRVEGEMPNIPKGILIGAPHTTNFDGVIGLLTLMAMGLDAHTMIKDTAFRGPLGWLLRWMGAIPINRRSPKGVVEQTVDQLNAREALFLLVAPEGTRRGAKQIKSGFYRIAAAANVPIIAAAADYRRKLITIREPLQPSGDFDTDLKLIIEFYRAEGYPKHPDRLSDPLR